MKRHGGAYAADATPPRVAAIAPGQSPGVRSAGALPRTPPGGSASWTCAKGGSPWNPFPLGWCSGRAGTDRDRSPLALPEHQPSNRVQRASPFAGGPGAKPPAGSRAEPSHFRTFARLSRLQGCGCWTSDDALRPDQTAPFRPRGVFRARPRGIGGHREDDRIRSSDDAGQPRSDRDTILRDAHRVRGGIRNPLRHGCAAQSHAADGRAASRGGRRAPLGSAASHRPVIP